MYIVHTRDRLPIASYLHIEDALAHMRALGRRARVESPDGIVYAEMTTPGAAPNAARRMAIENAFRAHRRMRRAA